MERSFFLRLATAGDLLRLPLGGYRVAIDEGLFLRIDGYNPTPHPSCLRYRSGNPPSPKGEGFKTLVYACFRLCRGEFLGGEPPLAFGWRGYAGVPSLPRGISRRGARAGEWAGADTQVCRLHRGGFLD